MNQSSDPPADRQAHKEKLDRVIKSSRAAYHSELSQSQAMLKCCLLGFKTDQEEAQNIEQAALIVHTIRGTAALLGWEQLGFKAGVVEDLLQVKLARPWEECSETYFADLDDAECKLHAVIDATLAEIEQMQAEDATQCPPDGL
jgi:chemotaxis protein histidine kinase CheA